MENVINFLLHHYREIILGIIAVLEIVILILKRGKSVALTDSQIQNVINWICEAETKYGSGNGSEKLNYVISQFRLYYPISNCEDWVLRVMIDGILKTPTKKGGPGREETK